MTNQELFNLAIQIMAHTSERAHGLMPSAADGGRAYAVAILEGLARNGNAEASWRLYLDRQGDNWLIEAAALGHPGAAGSLDDEQTRRAELRRQAIEFFGA